MASIRTVPSPRLILGGFLAVAGAILLVTGLLEGLALLGIASLAGLSAALLIAGLVLHGLGIALVQRPAPALAAWLIMVVLMTIVVILIGATVTSVLVPSV